MDERLAVLDDLRSRVRGLQPIALPDGAVIEGLRLLHALAQTVATAVLLFAREAIARDIPRRQAFTNGGRWLSHLLAVRAATVSKMLKLSAHLDDAPLVHDALASGRINTEQADIMASAVSELPPAVRAAGERLLVEHAADVEPRKLPVVCRELLRRLDPEGVQQREEDAAARGEKRAQERRSVTFSDVAGTSMVRMTAHLDPVGAAYLRTAIDALAAPRTRSPLGIPDPLGRPNPDPLGRPDPLRCTDPLRCPDPDPLRCPLTSDDAGPVTRVPSSSAPLGRAEPDRRTLAQRRHDALVELAKFTLATTELPDNGGDRPQVTVTIPWETLRGEHGLGLLDDGTPLTPSTCRLLACDARVLPAVMGGRSMPLDLGRERRTFSGALRKALNLRDGGCAFPACDRPVRWCEAHHCVPWHQNGPTDLSNGVLVCGFHHRVLHHSEWRVVINPLDGLPDFYAPPHLDPEQLPRRNNYHRRP